MSAGDLHVDVHDATLSSPCPVLISQRSTTSLPVQQQLTLKSRTDTDDSELLARTWKLANDKARELGWIV
jgi:hypothetical protein